MHDSGAYVCTTRLLCVLLVSLLLLLLLSLLRWYLVPLGVSSSVLQNAGPSPPLP